MNESYLDQILRVFMAISVLTLICAQVGWTKTVYPGKTWEFKRPEEVGLDTAKLDAFRDYLGGRGCVTRYGYMVYTWGDQSQRADVASALKPVITHFLIKALEDGKIKSPDEKVAKWEPRLNDLNAVLGYKDREITWRHMANQISCYGIPDKPGAAYDYNDWQISLLWDTLFLKVYGLTYETVDAKALHPLLTDVLQCEDNPTFMEQGTGEKAGRFGISVRDFARFGLLYRHKGNWNGKQLITKKHAKMVVTSPVPNSIPRTSAQTAAEMIPGQRSMGSRKMPDNQNDHRGSYSWLWWVNGVDREGKRNWPDAPVDTFGAFGHTNGKRAVVVIPSLEIVASWNDTSLGERTGNPRNDALYLLADAVITHKIGKTDRKSDSVPPRVIVMTDISTLVTKHAEPDDTQSLARLLLYSNDLDIEGLIATNTDHDDDIHPDYIRAILAKYGEVRDNLLLHDPRYPTARSLLDCTKAGNKKRDEIGVGEDTEGSDWIIKVVDKPDPRPVWILVWGGPRELAQALWKVERTRGSEEFAAFKSKIRVCAIKDQDKTGLWIRAHNPDLFYIMTEDVFRGMSKHGDASLVTPEWVDANVKKGRGPLGESYPNYDGGDPWGKVKGVKEGDTPTFLYLIPNGLGNPMQPTWGSWGGRFVGDGPHFFDGPDPRGIELSERSSVYRWRPAFQASFLARLNWCVKPYKEANHEPIAVLNGPTELKVHGGDTIRLSAAGSNDPDGDKLSYDWSFYPEPGTYQGPLEIRNSDKEEASFTAPNVDSRKTIHIILTVTDDGVPPLRSYKRVVVTVDPSVKG